MCIVLVKIHFITKLITLSLFHSPHSETNQLTEAETAAAEEEEPAAEEEEPAVNSLLSVFTSLASSRV